MKLRHVHHWTFDKLICAISIICLAVVLVLVLEDSLRTYFKSLSLGVRSLSLGVRSRRSLSWSLGVRSLSWSLGVRSLSLSWSLWVRSLLTSLLIVGYILTRSEGFVNFRVSPPICWTDLWSWKMRPRPRPTCGHNRSKRRKFSSQKIYRYY